MSADSEHTIVEFLSFFDVEKPDLARMMTYFAPDARYLSRVRHAEPAKGHAAISADLADQFSRYKDCQCKITSMASNGSQVFTERADTVTMLGGGKKVTVLVCAVFNLDPAGKITYWREYWDMGDIVAQMQAA
jgi:limonene-1,2-epoxide hydrolase